MSTSRTAKPAFRSKFAVAGNADGINTVPFTSKAFAAPGSSGAMLINR
jgi:hypothetical protein